MIKIKAIKTKEATVKGGVEGRGCDGATSTLRCRERSRNCSCNLPDKYVDQSHRSSTRTCHNNWQQQLATGNKATETRQQTGHKNGSSMQHNWKQFAADWLCLRWGRLQGEAGGESKEEAGGGCLMSCPGKRQGERQHKHYIDCHCLPHTHTSIHITHTLPHTCCLSMKLALLQLLLQLPRWRGRDRGRGTSALNGCRLVPAAVDQLHLHLNTHILMPHAAASFNPFPPQHPSQPYICCYAIVHCL